MKDVRRGKDEKWGKGEKRGQMRRRGGIGVQIGEIVRRPKEKGVEEG